MAANGNGNIFLLDANGDFDTDLNSAGFPRDADFGNAFLKLSTKGGLALADYFEMENEQQENNSDTDLGSGGALLLPPMKDSSGNIWQLAAGAGKDSNLYIVNCNSMGKSNPSGNIIYQELVGVLPSGIWSMPAFFQGNLYFGPVGQTILAFQFKNTQLSPAAVAQTSNRFGYPGATPSVSANNGQNGLSGLPRTPILPFYPVERKTQSFQGGDISDLAGSLLLVNVLFEDADWCSTTRSCEVGRRPQSALPIPLHQIGPFLSEHSAGHAFQRVD